MPHADVVEALLVILAGQDAAHTDAIDLNELGIGARGVGVGDFVDTLEEVVPDVCSEVSGINLGTTCDRCAEGRDYWPVCRVGNPSLDGGSLSGAVANGVTDSTQLFNQFRGGVGHVTLVDGSGDLQPPRIIEIGVALRF